MRASSQSGLLALLVLGSSLAIATAYPTLFVARYVSTDGSIHLRELCGFSTAHEHAAAVSLASARVRAAVAALAAYFRASRCRPRPSPSASHCLSTCLSLHPIRPEPARPTPSKRTWAGGERATWRRSRTSECRRCCSCLLLQMRLHAWVSIVRTPSQHSNPATTTITQLNHLYLKVRSSLRYLSTARRPPSSAPAPPRPSRSSSRCRATASSPRRSGRLQRATLGTGAAAGIDFFVLGGNFSSRDRC
jgi:hypothetical protein